MVVTRTRDTSRAWPAARAAAVSRSRISRAALRVKVQSSRFQGSTRPVAKRLAALTLMAVVLPEPGPANTSIGPDP